MKKISYITTYVLLFWLFGFAYFAWQINNFTIDYTLHTDAIITLTGGRNRIIEAVRLLQQGISPRLFISGVDKDISLQNIQNTQHFPLPNSQAIDIGHQATNTTENAIESNTWIQKNNIKSIRLVTSNYHIPRALVEFNKQNKSLKIIIHPVYSEKVEKKWWTSLRTFSLIFEEYNKFLYTYIRSKL